MALSLRTAELVNRGNELLTTFGTQERSLVDLVFREQAVCKQIQSMIDSFDPEQLAHKAVDTMVVLKEAQETYKDIKENIEKIESKEQELRSVIQQIFVRQQQGETETKKIKADLAQINQNLRRIADSIRETQRKLNRLQASLDFLDQHHRVVDRKKRRKRFIVETVGLAVVAISALFVGLSVNEFNEQRNQLITFRNGLKNGISSLIRQQNVNLARKNLLNQEERQRSMNFNSVRNILFSLETKKARGVKYRDYMVSLSSELSQVNNYVERLHSNIHFFSTIHEYLYKADNSSSFVVFLEHIALNSVSQSYRDLNNSWIAAKERPAVKFTMEINETELSPFEVLYFIANTPYN